MDLKSCSCKQLMRGFILLHANLSLSINAYFLLVEVELTPDSDVRTGTIKAAHKRVLPTDTGETFMFRANFINNAYTMRS